MFILNRILCADLISVLENSKLSFIIIIIIIYYIIKVEFLVREFFIFFAFLFSSFLIIIQKINKFFLNIPKEQWTLLCRVKVVDKLQRILNKEVQIQKDLSPRNVLFMKIRDVIYFFWTVLQKNIKYVSNVLKTIRYHYLKLYSLMI